MNSIFELNNSVTRGNFLKLNKPLSSLNIRQNNFRQRVINAWNRLPEQIIAATTVNEFKIARRQTLQRNLNTWGFYHSVPNILLKRCAHQIAPAMRSIFQLSVGTGKLPKDWLYANVSPVFKKGDVHLPENYRPVSLTCVSCKLLEHIICKHILDHLEKNKILTSLNHGFRSGYSCEAQLVPTIHDLLGKFDVGTQIDMAILGFSKAFDTVPHRKLLHKMELYGVTGNINSWLCNFLTNRLMKVVVDGEELEAVHGNIIAASFYFFV